MGADRARARRGSRLAALWWIGRGYANAEPDRVGWSRPRTTTTTDDRGHRRHDRPGPAEPADTALRQAFKDGWQPTFHTLPVRDGRGYAAVFSLPLGVTAEMIADQRPVLARNVHRAEVEVWPSDAEKAGTGPAGTAAVWIADSGVLSKPAPEYPLMHEGTADVFAGVPAGVSPRGDVLRSRSSATTSSRGGQMGQGKSNACRVVMLGCALDPLAELDVFVFANNGDFDAYAPRLALYHKGVEDDTIERRRQPPARAVRGGRPPGGPLAELGAKKVTAALAKAHRDLRPIVALFSECHELFGHEEYGEMAAELADQDRQAGPEDRDHAAVRHPVEPQGGDPAQARRAGQRQLLLLRQDLAVE